MRKDTISARFYRSLCRAVRLLFLGWVFFSACLVSQSFSAQRRNIAPLKSANHAPGVILAQHRRNDRYQKRLEQWQRMNPDEKDTLRRRMDEWKRMAPQDQQLYRQRFDQYKGLSAEERNQLDQKIQNWRDLSPAEKEDVRRRFR